MNRRTFLQRSSAVVVTALVGVGLSTAWLPQPVKHGAALTYLTQFWHEFYKNHKRLPQEFLVTKDLYEGMEQELTPIFRYSEYNSNQEVFESTLRFKSVKVSRSPQTGWRVILAS